MAGEPEGGQAAGDLAEAIRAIRERVRARHPSGKLAPFDIPLPDLTPVLHARDAAEAKVAAIGTVNPRPPGVANAAVQTVKSAIARALDWHVREQVEFNRGVVAFMQSTLEAMNGFNRALTELASGMAGLGNEARAAREEAAELKDVRSHWSAWRPEWERKLAANEMQFLRSVAELQGAFQHRVEQMESNFRDLVKSRQVDFESVLERSGLEIQRRLWTDLDLVAERFERLIHTELRIARQRASAAPPACPPTAPEPAPPALDWLAFASRFRGPEEHVRQAQRVYLPYFAGRRNVLDAGCGRGEFLELMKEAGVTARGVDVSAEAVRLCRAKGLQADETDLFVHLAVLPAGSLDGIFCGQVVEHLPPGRLPELIRLAAEALERGGILVVETPNPECLAVFATHFYLDPTHVRPVPPGLLSFCFEEAGFGRLELKRLAPAADSMPSLASLPEDFRAAFFDSLDYAVIGRKL